MKRFSSRIFALVLALMMSLVLLPIGVRADSAKTDEADKINFDENTAIHLLKSSGNNVTLLFTCISDQDHYETYKLSDVTIDDIAGVNVSGDDTSGYNAYVEVKPDHFLSKFNEEFKKEHTIIEGMYRLDDKNNKYYYIGVNFTSKDGKEWNIQPSTQDIQTKENITPDFTQEDFKKLNIIVNGVCNTNSNHNKTFELKNYNLNDVADFRYTENNVGILEIYPYYFTENLSSTYRHFFADFQQKTGFKLVHSEKGWAIATDDPEYLQTNTMAIHFYCDDLAKPTASELKDIFKGKITVECTTEKTHKSKSYDLLDKSYTVGNVKKTQDSKYGDYYYANVTINSSKYIDKYESATGVKHSIAANESTSKTFRVKFDLTSGEWVFDSSEYPEFNLKCDNAVQVMYRFYNQNSGEHFYTASAVERDYLKSLGWKYESIAWTAPVTSDTPVYRMYNPVGGEHHYTTSIKERDHLRSIGWNYEGIGWYSDDDKGTIVYRLYNPNKYSNNHHYTTSVQERDHLKSLGWRYEGIAWYGVEE